MEIVQRSRFVTAKPQTRNRVTTILLGYAILAIVFLTAMYFASTSSGTAAADFATMTVFP
jgi:hypothetical protein